MLKIKTFVLHVNQATGQFDEEALLAFQEEREIVEVARELLLIDGAPAWALMLTYRERPRPGQAILHRGNKPQIPPKDRQLYEALRAWRAKRADQIGKPVYALLTNQSLAAVAAGRPKTFAALQAIPGIGEARVKQHGQALLEIVAGLGQAGGVMVPPAGLGQAGGVMVPPQTPPVP
ncbi:HRDC domain-containing protein [Myxococcota bacterium]|nr:HRDC domain-containing protein [Myxococcota bacterium]